MIVLDASAVLAHLNDELGADRVEIAYPNSVIGSANLAEVVGKLVDNDRPPKPVVEMLAVAGVITLPVTADDALFAGNLRRHDWAHSLSLGDRLCLALGHRLGAVVLTADRAFVCAEPHVKVELLR